MSLPRTEDFVDMNEYFESLSKAVDMKKTKAIDLMDDLAWEYQRMSSSGKESFNQLCELFDIPTMEEGE